MLIVDDEEDLCFFAKSYFQRREYNVFVASNAAQALKIAKRENPSIMLLDVRLDDMNGIELLRRIKQENIPSKVIMVTSQILDDNTQQILKGMNIFRYFQKPVLLEKLQVAVNLALGNK